MSKIDYERKAYLLDSGLVKKVKKHNKKVFTLYHCLDEECMNNRNFEDMMFCQENNISACDLDDCRKIIDCHYKRASRVKKRIEEMLNYGVCNFITLNFSNKALDMTTKEQRKNLVKRYLKSQSEKYIANIDFGSKNGREHYHAIVIGKIDYSPWHHMLGLQHFGGVKGEMIHNSDDDYKKVSKYISKLTNHAIKNTTKGNRILYSR